MADGHQLVLFRVRKRSQGHTINHTEHRRCRADSECKGCENGKREPRTFAQHAQAITQILDRMLYDTDAPCVATLFLTLLRSFKCADGGIPRILTRHPFGDVFVSLPFEMELELVIKFLFNATTKEKGAQT